MKIMMATARMTLLISDQRYAEWYIQRSTAGYIGFQFGTPNDTTPTPADFTGDGKADIAFFKPSATGGANNWFVLRSEDFSFFAFPFGVSTDIPVPGDYDGDGKADPAVFRPSNFTWYLRTNNGRIHGSSIWSGRRYSNAICVHSINCLIGYLRRDCRSYIFD